MWRVQCIVDDGSRSVSYESGCMIGHFELRKVDGLLVPGGAFSLNEALYPFSVLFL